MSDRSVLGRAGGAAIIGGLLMLGSVAAELLFPVQNPDGTSREPVLHSVYVLAWIAGSSLIGAAVWWLRTFLAADGALSRKASIGTWLSVAGAAAFALSVAISLIGIATGSYLEAAFILFLVAYALLIPGQILLALAMRPISAFGWGWLLPILGAIGLFVAFAAEMDPYHDIGLFTFAIATIGLGLVMLRAER